MPWPMRFGPEPEDQHAARAGLERLVDPVVARVQVRGLGHDLAAARVDGLEDGLHAELAPSRAHVGLARTGQRRDAGVGDTVALELAHALVVEAGEAARAGVVLERDACARTRRRTRGGCRTRRTPTRPTRPRACARAAHRADPTSGSGCRPRCARCRRARASAASCPSPRRSCGRCPSPRRPTSSAWSACRPHRGTSRTRSAAP